MTAIEQLKQELLNQKTAIVAVGGTVSTEFTNPSPAEITAGIKTIKSVDFSLGTATADDVLSGKTFYAGNHVLKTGNLVQADNSTYEFILNNSTDETQVQYQVPSGTTKVRDYFMYHNPSHIAVYFNENLQEIGDHAFKSCKNFTFPNFTQMQNLTTIGKYSFNDVPSIDLENLPSCLITLGDYSFTDSQSGNTSIVIPSSVTKVGNYAFARSSSSSRYTLNNIDLSQVPANISLGQGVFQGIKALCDFTPPTNLTILPNYFNYYGGFYTINIPAHITKVGQCAFGNSASDKAEDILFNKVVFASETPPIFGSYPFGPIATRTNTRIYVPDQSVEAYKAVTQMAVYSNIIFPASQME